MEVPRDAEGRPRFSISQFRTYGAAELRMDKTEDTRGCPLLYFRKYVAKDIPGQIRAPVLELGSVLHAALDAMERDDLGPEQALERVWSPRLTETHWVEARETLLRYLDRGGPMTRFATLGSELDLSAQLYVDEEFGPVMFRGILDWVGVDLDDQRLLHVVDYKKQWAPPKPEAVRGDVQLKGYDWLARQSWARWMPTGSTPAVVMHLDSLRYRDVEVTFGAEEIDEFQAWATAVARAILRDEEHKPHLNEGCAWCPVQQDCPKWLGLPGTARSVVARRSGRTPAQLWARRRELAVVKKLVDAAVKDIDATLTAETEAAGRLEFADQVWSLESGWENEVDWARLQEVLGARFWAALSTSKTAVERASAGLDESTKAQAKACIRGVPSGFRVKKETV